MGWLFAAIYGVCAAALVHLWAGRAPPERHALRDFAIGALAGVLGFWIFGMRLGLVEPGALGAATLGGWFWAGLTSLIVSVLVQTAGLVRRA